METELSRPQDSDDSTQTLSEADFASLAIWHENDSPHLSPIGFRFLTRKDVELAVERWRQENGEPELPQRDWWQRGEGWRQGPNFAGLDFSGRDLAGMDLSGIILSYANLQEVNLDNARMVGAWLRRTNLERAYIREADLSQARFFEANLTETEFWRTDLSRASFRGTYLVRTRLLEANLDGAYFHRARMDNTEMEASQLGGSIGEERDREYSRAIEAYTRLKANFESLGRYADAHWAYRRERRMRKMWAGQQARGGWEKGNRRQVIKHWSNWASDWFVELLCDYGGSAWRVVGWIAVTLFVVGPVLISVLGGLEWTGSHRGIYSKLPTVRQKWGYTYFQYLLYMLDTFTTANFSGLEPETDALRIVSGLMAVWGIFLVGLLGFVAGNRIHNA
jgi:uncharacterized protein YjbI with pentapeptide repeats